MMNTVKALLISVLLVVLVFGGYLLFRTGDSSISPSHVAASSASAPALADLRAAEIHVTEGSIAAAVPSASSTTPAPKPVHVPDVAAQSASMGTSVAKAAPPEEKPHRKAAAPREIVQAQPSVSAPPPAVAATRASKPAGSAMTDELVRESAKLDPSLPPPDRNSLSSLSAPPSRDTTRRHGTNPVASAMTDGLVRESAKLDPALPPPDHTAH